MSTKKNAASEAQLKARRTSLGKKSNEELINIILRKDKTERMNNTKIKTLCNTNFEYLRRINSMEKVVKEIEIKDKEIEIKNKDIIITLKRKILNLYEDINNNNNTISYLTNKLKKTKEHLILACTISVILIAIIIVLGF